MTTNNLERNPLGKIGRSFFYSLAITGLFVGHALACPWSIYDDFSGSAIDTAKWSTTDPDANVFIDNGALNLNSGAAIETTTAYNYDNEQNWQGHSFDLHLANYGYHDWGNQIYLNPHTGNSCNSITISGINGRSSNDAAYKYKAQSGTTKTVGAYVDGMYHFEVFMRGQGWSNERLVRIYAYDPAVGTDYSGKKVLDQLYLGWGAETADNKWTSPTNNHVVITTSSGSTLLVDNVATAAWEGMGINFLDSEAIPTGDSISISLFDGSNAAGGIQVEYESVIKAGRISAVRDRDVAETSDKLIDLFSLAGTGDQIGHDGAETDALETSGSFTLTYTYDETALADAGITDESDLKVLAYTNGLNTPPADMQAIVDSVNNTLTFTIKEAFYGYYSVGLPNSSINVEENIVVKNLTDTFTSKGWRTSMTCDTATGESVDGPATPPCGTGSYRLTLHDPESKNAARLACNLLDGKNLSDLTDLVYSTYKVTGEAAYVYFYVDTNNDGDMDDMLFFVPGNENGSIVTDVWQTWNARAGKWYWLSANSEYKTYDQIIAENPTAKFTTETNGAIRFTTGYDPVDSDTYLDQVIIGVEGQPITLYDFEKAVPGDANNDGMVDVGDLGILAANYGMTNGATWEQGDFNDDGAVDVGDLGILAAHYGEGVSGAVDFDTDYAKAFGQTVENDGDNAETTKPMLSCSSLGLPLIAGLLLAGLTLMGGAKLKD